ncbi:MAG: hypothetical protein HOE44_07100 [Candidatus Marinimicrobia bacterium]|nr:hypothetical protein [Candidatus Neomarinimicrobiota bacterium]
MLIDIGVSYIKLAVSEGGLLSDVRRFESPSSAASNIEHIHETDSDIFFSLVKSAIDSYILNHPPFKGILFSTQMHGFVLVDGYEAMSPYFSWKHELDKVSAHEYILDGLTNSIERNLIQKTGMPLRSGLPSVNLHIMAINGDLNGSSSFGTIADFVVAKLTKTKISTSISNAAGSGLFDLAINDWNYKLINELKINVEFPRLIRSYTEEEIGEYLGVPIYVPIGDQQASVIGLVRDFKDVAIANIATGSQSTVIVDHLRFSDSYQTRPLIDHYNLLTIPFLPAGRALNSVVKLISEIGDVVFGVSDIDVWKKIAKYGNDNIDDSSLKINIDFFSSLKDGGGSISNITENNLTIKNVINSAIIDMVSNHLDALDVLYGEVKYNKLYLSGGLSTKLKMVKELFDENIVQEVCSANEEEDALNGLMVLSQRI